MLIGTKAAQRSVPVFSLFLLVMGGVFLYWGISLRPEVLVDPFMTSMGSVFAVWGIVSFFIQRRRR